MPLPATPRRAMPLPCQCPANITRTAQSQNGANKKWFMFGLLFFTAPLDLRSGCSARLMASRSIYPNQAICRNALAANHLADINLLGQHGKCQLRPALGGKLLHSRG